MAISITNKISETLSTGTSFTTSTTLTPSANKLYLCAIEAKATSPGPTPTLTGGGGLTWVQITTVDATNRRITVFRAMKASGLSSGTLTASFGGTNVDNVSLHVCEVSGVDVSGTDGSGAIVQSNTNSGSATSGNVTLSAFGSALNAAYGAFGHNAAEAATPESGYTELTDTNIGDTGLETEWKIGSDTSVTASWSTNTNWRAVALELKKQTSYPVNQATESDTTFSVTSYNLPSVSIADDWPALRIEMGFGYGPADALNVIPWTDVTNYVRSFSITRGKSHELEPAQAGTMTMALDNRDRRFEPEYAGSPYSGMILPLVPVRVLASWSGTIYPLYCGFVEEWPVTWKGSDSQITITCTDYFETLNSVLLNATLGSAVAGTRIGDVLDLAGVPSAMRSLDSGDSTLTASTLANVSALQHALDANASDLGFFYVGKDGLVTFKSRSSLKTETSIGSFGDGDGDIPIKDSLVMAFTKNEIRNDVIVTADATQNKFESSDSTSIGIYGTRSYAITALLGDTDAASLADFLLNFYANPHTRFNQITLDPRDDPDVMWPVVLDVELGDRLTITRTPDGVNPITEDRFVEGLSHNITKNSGSFRWSTTINTGQPLLSTGSPWTLGTSTLGGSDVLQY